MTARVFLIRTLVFAAGVAAGLVALANYPVKLSDQGVTIDVRDRRYACGECYVRFGISKIHGKPQTEGARQASPHRFDGWDVVVLFKGSDRYLEGYQSEMFAKDQNCAWPTFRLTGQFKRKLVYALLWDGDRYDGIYFEAHEGVAVHSKPCNLGERPL